MNIPESLKTDLILEFKSEIRLNKYFENYELYKFASLNSSQILKLYSAQNSKIFNEPNAKKHFQKVQEMIKNNFYNEKTKDYLNLFFIPTNNVDVIKKRRDAILKLINLESNLKLHEKIIKQNIFRLEIFDTKIIFSKSECKNSGGN